MTGWYPHVRGHRTMSHMLHDDEPFLLEDLKNSGYHVWWAGKNDVLPGQNGFPRGCSELYSVDGKAKQGMHANLSWRSGAADPGYYSFHAGELSEEEFEPDGDWVAVRGAVDFLENREHAAPFCLYLPLMYPHPPYGVERPWYGTHDRNALPRRRSGIESTSGLPSMLHKICENQNLYDYSEAEWNELQATYYDMCARVDHQLGLIIDALKSNDLYEDTLIVFFSDHGDFAGDYGLVEKCQNCFPDSLVNVPLVIKPPVWVEKKAGLRDSLVELIDIPATLYQLCGIEATHWHFGRSLVPLLTEDRPHRTAVFSEGGRLKDERQCMEFETVAHGEKGGLYYPRVTIQRSDHVAHTKALMCRTDGWKYVYRLYENDELYDLSNDPDETRNLAKDGSYSGILQEMKQLLLDHCVETSDVVPLVADERTFQL